MINDMIKKISKYILWGSIIIVFVFLAFYIPRGVLHKLKTKEDTLKLTASKNASVISKGKAIKQENKDLQKYINRMSTVKSKTDVFKDKLNNIEGCVPVDVTIQNLSYDKKIMKIKAYTKDHDSISEFAAKLQLSGKYKDVRVLDIDQYKDTGAYVFNMNVFY